MYMVHVRKYTPMIGLAAAFSLQSNREYFHLIIIFVHSSSIQPGVCVCVCEFMQPKRIPTRNFPLFSVVSPIIIFNLSLSPSHTPSKNETFSIHFFCLLQFYFHAKKKSHNTLAPL